MCQIQSKKITNIVTAVTGLLRVKLCARNAIKAFTHLHFSDSVTSVTGLCACARVRNIFLYSIFQFKNNFSRVRETACNTRNTRNNHCFYYIFIFCSCNKSTITRNKSKLCRNTHLKIQQGL